MMVRLVKFVCGGVLLVFIVIAIAGICSGNP